MSEGVLRVPTPSNEPVLSFAPGQPERQQLAAALAAVGAAGPVEIPCVINGVPVYTGRRAEVRNPSAHGEVLAYVHLAGPVEVRAAVEGAMAAKATWAALPFDQRASVFLRAAETLAGRHRMAVLATTMLGQGKTAHQAEIDAVCELVDFWRFNVAYADQLLREQPTLSGPGVWNRMDHRPLDGFVFAVAPFNFSSIALNLPTAPALMGNVVLWKPALTSARSTQVLWDLLVEAGLPAGVIQVLHGHGADVGDAVLDSPDLGGLHFTGSTGTFRALYLGIAQRLDRYRQIPRIVGETGGKDFVVAHSSADLDVVSTALLRGAFEYQGQKCSAASRAYVPSDRWPELRERLADETARMKQGDVRDLSVFVGPVIDERAFERVASYVDLACAEGEIVAGGRYSRAEGWFVAPTVVALEDPKHRLMQEEVFGPLLSVFVYEPDAWSETLRLVDTTSPYALTGAVLAQDRHVLHEASQALRFAAGNFYLNDKPTGAVVGQQPFGGGRASGTNDKAGSPLNLQRWLSPRTIKETWDAPRHWSYPFLDPE